MRKGIQYLGLGMLFITTFVSLFCTSVSSSSAIEINSPSLLLHWYLESIEKQEAQHLDSYDIVSDIGVGGRGIPLYRRQDETEEALETIIAELKIFGKRGVHKDTKLWDQGGEILENDEIVYNCAFVVSDREEKSKNCTIPAVEVEHSGFSFNPHPVVIRMHWLLLLQRRCRKHIRKM